MKPKTPIHNEWKNRGKKVYGVCTESCHCIWKKKQKPEKVLIDVWIVVCEDGYLFYDKKKHTKDSLDSGWEILSGRVIKDDD